MLSWERVNVYPMSRACAQTSTNYFDFLTACIASVMGAKCEIKGHHAQTTRLFLYNFERVRTVFDRDHES
jgi:hypothetical protein